jgi:hypothetical protein
MAYSIKTHNGGWAVFADWYGAERPVAGGAGTSLLTAFDLRDDLELQDAEAESEAAAWWLRQDVSPNGTQAVWYG